MLLFYIFVVFDDEDENKLSYTEIHLQYKKLVSTTFGPDVSKMFTERCKFVPHLHALPHQHY